jgi:ABC-type lipoprotein release transport system permease subunit
MNFTDIIALALRNLRQAKLRTTLTAIGVIVGVAAIVTMVSFGIGLQQNIIGQAFARLDAFTAITVVGADADDLLALSEGRTALDEETTDAQGDNATPSPAPTIEATPTPRRPQRALDDQTLAEIQKMPGVRFAAPIISFGSYVRFNDRTRYQTIFGATPRDDPRFKTFLAGGGFTTDSSDEAVINENFLSQFSAAAFRERRNRRGNPGGPFQAASTKSDEERQREAQAALNKEIVLLSAPTNETPSAGSIFGIPLIDLPSGADDNKRAATSGEAVDESRFERRVFRIVGVLKSEEGINFSPFGNANFYLPLEQAKQLRVANLSPLERMGEALTASADQTEQPRYRALELRVTDPSQIKPVTTRLNELGLRALSVTTQLEEIERVFLIINSSLALIGGIALLVAAFGISNTMIMSIRERTREIGIMKAIGGSDGEIMRIFFIEASLIGLAGGVLGLLGGWGIDRVANLLANRWIAQQAGRAVRHIEFFSIPWYLSGGAILFALLVSLAAAIYPAFSAARVDPIKALRHE